MKYLFIYLFIWGSFSSPLNFVWISACAFCALSGSVQFSCTFLACSFLRDLVAIFILYFWSFVASENFVALLAQCSSYHSLLHLPSLLRRNNLSWFLYFFFLIKKKKSFSSCLHKREKSSRLHPTLTWRASRFHTAKYLWVFIYRLLNFWFLRGSGGDGERRVELGSSSSFLPFVFGLLFVSCFLLFSSGSVFAFVNLLCHDQKFSSFLAFACVCLCV